MIEHLIDFNLLDPYQHGFMSGRSRATNFIESLDIVTEALENILDVDEILLFCQSF
jgi:hypothetical protein